MRVAIAADHNGVALKQALRERLRAAGHEIDDRGVDDADTVVDYPRLCVDACRRVLEGDADRAIIVGGAGAGEVIACNKVRGIRAALGWSEETAAISRRNNDANVLVLGAKLLSAERAGDIADVWLRTEFSGGRHAQRLQMIVAIERGERLD